MSWLVWKNCLFYSNEIYQSKVVSIRRRLCCWELSLVLRLIVYFATDFTSESSPHTLCSLSRETCVSGVYSTQTKWLATVWVTSWTWLWVLPRWGSQLYLCLGVSTLPLFSWQSTSCKHLSTTCFLPLSYHTPTAELNVLPTTWFPSASNSLVSSLWFPTTVRDKKHWLIQVHQPLSWLSRVSPWG